MNLTKETDTLQNRLQTIGQYILEKRLDGLHNRIAKFNDCHDDKGQFCDTGGGGGSASSSGSGGSSNLKEIPSTSSSATSRSLVESIMGKKFNPGSAKTIGDKTGYLTV